MQFGLSELWRQSHSLGKLIGGLLVSLSLHEQRSILVVQVRAFRIKFDSLRQFGSRIRSLPIKTQNTSQRSVRFCALAIEPRGFPRFSFRACEVALADQGIRQIHVRQQKSWIETNRRLQLRHSVVHMPLREQHIPE
jgi:hypothetical protein